MHSMYSKNIFYIILIFFFISGCKKDDVTFPVEPSISLVNITPSHTKQYKDPVTITIHYEDGDGDLGENNDQIKNCYVTDNRINIIYEYRIKELAPKGYSIPIEGNLNIDIGGQAITDSSSQQSATYTLYVVDRAGHKSNSITTDAITITR